MIKSNNNLNTLLLLLFLVFASCSGDDDNNSSTNSGDTSGGTDTTECTNGNVFTISGGLACNNTPTGSIYTTIINGNNRQISFNHVPPHATLGNVTGTSNTYTVPAIPTQASSITDVANTSYSGSGGQLGWKFGIATSGVPFDPVANEPWVNTATGALNYEWNLEILSSAHSLVYDCNNAHDTARYHYHGVPTPYMNQIGEDGNQHSQLIGFAADGFPIYYKYGYLDPNDTTSNIVELSSSYRIKSGCRPGDGVSAPSGGYDGTYVNDYEYVSGIGDLDECNGRWSITPEYPSGTYAYYVTDDFPSIPRCFKGTPSSDFIVGN